MSNKGGGFGGSFKGFGGMAKLGESLKQQAEKIGTQATSAVRANDEKVTNNDRNNASTDANNGDAAATTGNKNPQKEAAAATPKTPDNVSKQELLDMLQKMNKKIKLLSQLRVQLTEKVQTAEDEKEKLKTFVKEDILNNNIELDESKDQVAQLRVAWQTVDEQNSMALQQLQNEFKTITLQSQAETEKIRKAAEVELRAETEKLRQEFAAKAMPDSSNDTSEQLIVEKHQAELEKLREQLDEERVKALQEQKEELEAEMERKIGEAQASNKKDNDKGEHDSSNNQQQIEELKAQHAEEMKKLKTAAATQLQAFKKKVAAARAAEIEKLKKEMEKKNEQSTTNGDILPHQTSEATKAELSKAMEVTVAYHDAAVEQAQRNLNLQGKQRGTLLENIAKEELVQMTNESMTRLKHLNETVENGYVSKLETVWNKMQPKLADARQKFEISSGELEKLKLKDEATRKKLDELNAKVLSVSEKAASALDTETGREGTTSHMLDEVLNKQRESYEQVILSNENKHKEAQEELENRYNETLQQRTDAEQELSNVKNQLSVMQESLSTSQQNNSDASERDSARIAELTSKVSEYATEKESLEIKLEKLIANHKAALEQAESAKESVMAEAKSGHEAAENQRVENEARLREEYEANLAAAEKEREALLSDAKASFETEISALKAEHDSIVDDLTNKITSTEASLKGEFEATLAKVQKEKEEAIAGAEQTNRSASENIKKETEEKIQLLETNHKAALEEAEAAKESAIAEAKSQHEAEVSALKAEHDTVVGDLTNKISSTEASLKEEFAAALATVQKEKEEAIAGAEQTNRSASENIEKETEEKIQLLETNHKAALEEVEAAKESAIAEAKSQHEAEVSALKAEHDSVVGYLTNKISSTEASLKEEFEATLAKVQKEKEEAMAVAEVAGKADVKVKEAVEAVISEKNGEINIMKTEYEEKLKVAITKHDKAVELMKKLKVATKSKLESVGQEHKGAMDRAEKQRIENEARLKNEYEANLAAVEKEREALLADAKASFDSDMAALKAEHGTIVGDLTNKIASTEASLKEKFSATLAKVQKEKEEAIAGAEQTNRSVSDNFEKQTEEKIQLLETKHKTALEQAEAAKESAIAQAKSEHEAALSTLRSKYKAVLSKLESQKQAVVDKLMSDLGNKMDSMTANHNSKALTLKKTLNSQFEELRNLFTDERGHTAEKHAGKAAQLETEMKEREKKFGLLVGQLKSTIAASSSTREENEALQSKLESEFVAKQGLKKQIEGLEKELSDSVSNSEAAAASLLKRQESLEGETGKLKESLQEVLRERDEKVRTIEELTGKLSALSYSLDSTVEERRKQDEKLQDAAKKEIKLNSTEEELAGLRAQINKLKLEETKNSSLVARLQAEKDASERKHGQRTALVGMLEEQLATLSDEKTETTAKLEAALYEISQKNEEIAMMEDKVKSAESSLAETQNARKMATETLSTATKGADAKKAKMVETLQREIQSLQQQMARKSAAAQRMLKEREAECIELRKSNKLLQVELDKGSLSDRRIFELAAKQSNRESVAATEIEIRDKVVERLTEKLQTRDGELASVEAKNKDTENQLEELCRVRRREDVNLDYLKSIVVQYLSHPAASSERAALLPVLATLLQFDENDYITIEKGKEKLTWWGSVAPTLIGTSTTPATPAPPTAAKPYTPVASNEPSMLQQVTSSSNSNNERHTSTPPQPAPKSTRTSLQF